MITDPMTSLERRSVFSLASILCLRLLGLFMILPVFTLYAHHLVGATPLLIGIALGIYGLTQAIFQIPFGMLSDFIGRKPIILSGLIIFGLGSVIAALSHTITGMIIGRSLQGAGAIGSTIAAMIADLTRESQRTKAMAINGISIGMIFSLAMILGPLFAAWLQVPSIFWLSAILTLIAIAILFFVTPSPQKLEWHSDAEPDRTQFLKIITDSQLIRFNLSVFLLHGIFTATFIVLPLSLHLVNGISSAQQWKIFLPTLILAFIISMAGIGIAEKTRQFKPFFLVAIALLFFAEFIWHFGLHSILLESFGIFIFFTAFTLLEAFLPSLVSRTAPIQRKGTAMGVYSCSQFLGIFFGGTLGGWIYSLFNLTGVYLFCLSLTVLWLFIALGIRNPQYSTLPQSRTST